MGRHSRSRSVSDDRRRRRGDSRDRRGRRDRSRSGGRDRRDKGRDRSPSVRDDLEGYCEENKIGEEVRAALEKLSSEHRVAVFARGPVNPRDISRADQIVAGRIEAESGKFRRKRNDDGQDEDEILSGSRWGRRRGDKGGGGGGGSRKRSPSPDRHRGDRDRRDRGRDSDRRRGGRGSSL
eukprot:Hpha_TRINITY_DN32559_c0_g1::TRINITY_DN32559_c0_g1_i1::g.24413::m.24413